MLKKKNSLGTQESPKKNSTPVRGALLFVDAD